MELQQLNYFLAVAKTENMSQAAKGLFITQSALSKSVAQLENELGVNLFIRNGKSLELSGFGRVFYEYVESGLSQLSSGKQELLKMAQIPHPVLSLHIAMPEVFQSLVPSFLKQYPKIEIRQRLLGGKELAESLLNGKTDISISLRPETNRNLRWIPVLDEPLLLLAPNHSPLLQRESICLHELGSEKFVDIANSETRMICESLFGQAGISYPLGIEVQDDRCLYAMVENNCGLAFVPALDYLRKRASESHMGVTARRISSPRCVRTIGITIPACRTMTEEATLFYQFALECFCAAQQVLAQEGYV